MRDLVKAFSAGKIDSCENSLTSFLHDKQVVHVNDLLPHTFHLLIHKLLIILIFRIIPQEFSKYLGAQCSLFALNKSLKINFAKYDVWSKVNLNILEIFIVHLPPTQEKFTSRRKVKTLKTRAFLEFLQKTINKSFFFSILFVQWQCL